MTLFTKVFVGVGANMAHPFTNVCRALDFLSRLPGCKEFRRSSLYRTPPVSPVPQGDYINAVCSFSTSLSHDRLFFFLQNIERKLGKRCKHRNDPRPIDLDLLFYGDQAIHQEHLQVPHPRWKERAFVLLPLSELEEEIVCPSSSKEEMSVTFHLSKLMQLLPQKDFEGIVQMDPQVPVIL